MPAPTRGTPHSSCLASSAPEAFPRPAPARPRPSSAPRDGIASAAGSVLGSDFSAGDRAASRRPSTASSARGRKKLSVKDEIESLEQELYELEQKMRFRRV
jgi:hypothetical protein